MSRVIAVLTGRRGAVIAAGMRGIAGVGSDGRVVAGVSISLDSRLIVTYTDGTSQDAGAVPRGDDVEALAAALAQTNTTISSQAEVISALIQRVEALESGAGPVIPPGAMVDNEGQVLVDGTGEVLVVGPEAIPPTNTSTAALVDGAATTLTDDQAQTLTAGE